MNERKFSSLRHVLLWQEAGTCRLGEIPVGLGQAASPRIQWWLQSTRWKCQHLQPAAQRDVSVWHQSLTLFYQHLKNTTISVYHFLKFVSTWVYIHQPTKSVIVSLTTTCEICPEKPQFKNDELFLWEDNACGRSPLVTEWDLHEHSLSPMMGKTREK